MTQYRLPFQNPDLADGFGSTASPRTRPHRGLDFAQPVGTPMGSIAEGVLVYSGLSSELGHHSVVRHPDGMFSGYCHSRSASPVAVGTSLTMGGFINYVGDKGFVTGPHLHLTLSTSISGVGAGQVQDPYPYIMARLLPNGDPPPPPDPTPAPAPSGLWTEDVGLKVWAPIKSATGLIRVTISAYGAGALITYSIAGVKDRTTDNANTALLLTSSGECTASRTWIQQVPVNREVNVQVECFGRLAGAFVASPTLVVEVVS